MASAKLATLVIRTLAKPISNQIKTQVKQHETFRNICVGLAQRMHRGEIQLRMRLLGESPKHVRPLSETRAIENGANALAEGFLFSVAAALILAETWRSSRNNSKRREDVDDRIGELQEQVTGLTEKVDSLSKGFEEKWEEERARNDELTRILERVVEIGLRGGWAEFEGTPLTLPRIELNQRPNRDQSSSTPAEAPSAPSSPPDQTTRTDIDK
ncbi:OPA3 domain-containing protein [Phanerochaete sordida]|uniref:OPA3 domain-containing protein n=1 Tax=Phanerochaete sordida TaxID=48140 RepID=A0A9P3LBR5_9APHY|nr:OPA3 domain-containing protein [Phanerochaete sordida]